MMILYGYRVCLCPQCYLYLPKISSNLSHVVRITQLPYRLQEKCMLVVLALTVG